MKKSICCLLCCLLLAACAATPTGDASSVFASSRAGVPSVIGSSSAASLTNDASETAASPEEDSSATVTSDASSESASEAASSSVKATPSKTASATSSKTTSSQTAPSTGTSSQATSSTAAVTRVTLPFKRGMNINRMEGNAYSTSSWSNTYYLGLDSTYSDLKAKGFDHVRFPVCLSKYYDTSKDALRTSGSYSIANVDMVINKAINAGLYVILDFHDFNFNNTGASFAANNADQRTLFVKIWTKLAEHYKNYSDKLVFELINEPEKDSCSPANLNKALNDAIDAIRKTNATRWILATVTDKSQPWLLTNNNYADTFKLTVNTTHVGVVAHCYNPGDFTHQGTSTWGAAYAQHDHQVRLSDSARSSLRWDLNQVKKFADANPNLPIMVNEFSVMQRLADKGDVTEYLATVRSFCEENDIPWTYWQYIGTNEMGARTSYNGNWIDFVMKGLGLQ